MRKREEPRDPNAHPVSASGLRTSPWQEPGSSEYLWNVQQRSGAETLPLGPLALSRSGLISQSLAQCLELSHGGKTECRKVNGLNRHLRKEGPKHNSSVSLLRLAGGQAWS